MWEENVWEDKYLRRKRETENLQYEVITLPIDPDEFEVSLESQSPNSMFTLQTVIGGLKGQETEAQGLFSDLNFGSPSDHVTSIKVLDNNLAAVIEVENPTGFDKGEGPPVSLVLWDEEKANRNSN